jgi:hypothetical protein
MDPQTLLNIMTVFVIVAAIALLIQAGLMFGIYKSTREVSISAQRLIPKVEALVPKIEAAIPKIEAVIPNVQALLESSRGAVDDSRKLIGEVTFKTSEILETARRQMVRVDEVFEDAAGRAKVQLDRAEMVLDDTMTRAQETVALVHSGILKPLREIQGVSIGVRTALNFLMRGRRDPARATADEEMFI